MRLLQVDEHGLGFERARTVPSSRASAGPRHARSEAALGSLILERSVSVRMRGARLAGLGARPADFAPQVLQSASVATQEERRTRWAVREGAPRNMTIRRLEPSLPIVRAWSG